MKKEIVWVMGSSAAGKETFIKKIVSGNELVGEYGWENRAVAFSQVSVDCIGQTENDPILESRNTITNEVEDLLVNNDVVLVKWQFVDSEAGRLELLRNKFQNVKHRIVFVQVSDQELSRRLVEKSWWRKEFDLEEWIEEEKELLRVELRKYGGNFDILNI